MSPNPFSSDNPYASQRSSVMARNVVASSQPLAAAAGAQMFARGGNAIDAAVAALDHADCHRAYMNGIGSDGFSRDLGRSEIARASIARAAHRRPGQPSALPAAQTMPTYGWDSVTVPGAVAQWMALSKRFGRLPFADLFEPAIRHARDGFAVAPIVARQWRDFSVGELIEQAGFKQAFLPEGALTKAGERWQFADQARTLEEIAQSGGESFYRGRAGQGDGRSCQTVRRADDRGRFGGA